jgi:hypothetical protein
MKKYVLAGTLAISALFGLAAQAAPVTGPAAMQAAQGTVVQKVWDHGHGGWGHGYGHGWGHGGYGRGWGHGRWGYHGYGRGYGWGWGYGSWCYWHPYRCGYRW